MTTDDLGPACRAVSELWDGLVEDFLGGGSGVSPHLESWAASYQGRSEGAVQWDALPELFLGPLTKPRGVFLALNPGKSYSYMHGRAGVFADEIRKEYGSYSAWAASWPYLRNPWATWIKTEEKRTPHHHRSRLRFLRDWTGEKDLPCNDMVSFELYPWHSRGITAPLGGEGAAEFIYEYIWKPVEELGAPVFAFGADWFSILQNPFLGLDVVKRLGVGGVPYRSHVKSRSVIVLRGSGGLTVIAAKHSGSAGPPNHEDTLRLRDAIDRCQ